MSGAGDDEAAFLFGDGSDEEFVDASSRHAGAPPTCASGRTRVGIPTPMSILGRLMGTAGGAARGAARGGRGTARTGRGMGRSTAKGAVGGRGTRRGRGAPAASSGGLGGLVGGLLRRR